MNDQNPNPYEAPQDTQQNGGGDAQLISEDAQPSQQENATTEDIFANVDKQEEDANDESEVKQDELNVDEQKAKSEDEPTFLSVWQEERKLELEKRRSQEKEAQEKLNETAQQALEKFETDRAKRMENKEKENREKEKDLRDDLDAVFKHGTIWEQVGKMVNLNEKMSA